MEQVFGCHYPFSLQAFRALTYIRVLEITECGESPTYNKILLCPKGFPGGSEVKVSACNGGDPGLIPGSGRSPREGNGNPLQYSCLENPMDGGAW